METGSHGLGGRRTFDRFMRAETWKGAVDEALRQALTNLDQFPLPPAKRPSFWAAVGPVFSFTRP